MLEWKDSQAACNTWNEKSSVWRGKKKRINPRKIFCRLRRRVTWSLTSLSSSAASPSCLASKEAAGAGSTIFRWEKTTTWLMLQNMFWSHSASHTGKQNFSYKTICLLPAINACRQLLLPTKLSLDRRSRFLAKDSLFFSPFDRTNLCVPGRVRKNVLISALSWLN